MGAARLLGTNYRGGLQSRCNRASLMHRPRLAPTFVCHPVAWRNSCGQWTATRRSHERHIGTPCACVRMRQQMVVTDDLAAALLGSNIRSPLPRNSGQLRRWRYREYPLLAQGHRGHLNQHQHDWARRSAGGADGSPSHATPRQMPENLLATTSARV